MSHNLDNAETYRLARILWDYHNFQQPPRSADLLLVMGSNHTGIAEHAADLCKLNEYKHIIVSGGVFHDHWQKGKAYKGIEADVFAKVMIDRGVDPTKVIRETAATNTGQNVTLSRALKHRFATSITTGQLVHKPTMQRRALATANQQWSDVAWTVSGQTKSLAVYKQGCDENQVISELVANTAKILFYPLKGFQTPQLMPDYVKEAMQTLCRAGFTSEMDGDTDLLRCAGLLDGPDCARTNNNLARSHCP